MLEDVLNSDNPLYTTTITAVRDDHLYYRGMDVVELSKTETMERVAALLWTGDLTTPLPWGSPSIPNSAMKSELELPYLDRFRLMMANVSAHEKRAFSHDVSAALAVGTHVVAALAETATGKPFTGIAETLQQAWLPEEPEALKTLTSALILMADHPQNATAFTARYVASVATAWHSPYLAALSTYHGPARQEAVFSELLSTKSVSDVVATRLKKDGTVAGFGHPFYTSKDPRGEELMRLARASRPNSPVVELGEKAIAEVSAQTGWFPNMDFCLVVFAHALNIPSMALFAVGRSLSWVANTVEQYEREESIQLLSRYTGK